MNAIVEQMNAAVLAEISPMGARQKAFVQALMTFPPQIRATEGRRLLAAQTGIEIPPSTAARASGMTRVLKLIQKARRRTGIRVVADGNEFWWVRDGFDFVPPSGNIPQIKRISARHRGFEELHRELDAYRPRTITPAEMRLLLEEKGIPHQTTTDKRTISRMMHRAGYRGMTVGPATLRAWCRDGVALQMNPPKTLPVPIRHQKLLSSGRGPLANELGRLLLVALNVSPVGGYGPTTMGYVEKCEGEGCGKPLWGLSTTGGRIRRFCSVGCRKRMENRRRNKRPSFRFTRPVERFQLTT